MCSRCFCLPGQRYQHPIVYCGSCRLQYKDNRHSVQQTPYKLKTKTPMVKNMLKNKPIHTLEDT